MFARAKRHRSARHGASAPVRLLALAAMLVIGLGQFSIAWHEGSVQHVRCAEHGELTDVVMAPDHGTSPIVVDHLAITSAPAAPVGHEHCDFVIAIQSNAQVPVVRTSVRLALPPVAAPWGAEPAPLPGRVFVLASAPKTSPPAA
jgi:hypothetical protein